MHVWLIHLGELLPIDGNPRLFRYGVLAEMLSHAGHRVTRWAPTFVHATKTYRAPAACRIDVDENYEIELLHARGYRRHIGAGRFLFHRGIVRAFARRAERVARPDVVLCALPTPEMCAAAVDYGQRSGVPIVLDVRDLWPDLLIDLMPRWVQKPLQAGLAPYRRLNHRTFAAADGIVGISPGFLRWGLQQAGRPQGGSDRVCHMGHRRKELSDDQLLEARARWSALGVHDDGRFRCTFSGTIGHLFDLETVIAAARAYHDAGSDDFQFVICGDGAKLPYYKRLAEGLPNVVFPGWVAADDIAVLHEMSCVGVAPYLQKIDTTYPNKVVDYMSRGLPVVATRAGELAALVERHQIGTLYEEGDCRDLCRVLDRLQADPALCHRWRSNACDLYAQDFDADRVYSEFIDYLDGISRRTLTRERVRSTAA